LAFVVFPSLGDFVLIGRIDIKKYWGAYFVVNNAPECATSAEISLWLLMIDQQRLVSSSRSAWLSGNRTRDARAGDLWFRNV
jgi:hypothetical protein